MRLMSFALTTAQLLDGSKTVTRRVGWANLKPGDRLKAVRKAMGLRLGEKVDVLAEIEVVSVRRERLDAVDAVDCIAEGFPDMSPDEFVEFFLDANNCKADTEVTRIEFRVVPGIVVAQPTQVALPGVSP